MTGVALVTLAGFSWIFVLPASLRGRVENPYIGLLVFIAIPAVFFAGLILIPIGIALGNRRVTQQLATLPDRRTALRRAGIFFAVMTAANVVIGSQLSYRAVEHMDTVQFCGQSCHVMKPEFTAHLQPPHQACPRGTDLDEGRVPVTGNLGRLLLVRVSRKTFKIYNIQMGGFRPGNPMVHLCVHPMELQ